MHPHHLTRRILVPLDGSDLAASTYPHLRALACVESEILLLGVVDMADRPDVPSASDRQRQEFDHCFTYLRSAARALHDVTPHVTVMVSSGAPADEILRIAMARDVGLIVMPAHQPGAIRVIQASPMPVMLVHPRHDPRQPEADAWAHYHRIVVPLDGSDRSRVALPVALKLAQTLNVPVHLLRAIPLQDDFFAVRDSAIDRSQIHRFADSVEQPQANRDVAYYEEYCSSLSDALNAEAARLRASGADASAEVVFGPPVPSILSVAHADDIIVLSSHGVGGVRYWLMGSVAEKVVALATSPVVMVPVAERVRLTAPVREHQPIQNAPAESAVAGIR